MTSLFPLAKMAETHPAAFIDERVSNLRQQLQLLRCVVGSMADPQRSPFTDFDEDERSREHLVIALADLFGEQDTALDEIDACLEQLRERGAKPVEQFARRRLAEEDLAEQHAQEEQDSGTAVGR